MKPAAWPYARVLAHRGGGALAPENTIAAIDVAHDLGFRAIEFDVRLARDGVPVVIHDATLERTTDATGPVAARTAAELGRIDAGRGHVSPVAGVAVPTLEAVVRHCRARGIWPNIEIKRVAGEEERVGEVVARTVLALYRDVLGARSEDAPLDARAPLLSSFSRAALVGARRVAPMLARGYLVHEVPADWREALESLGCVSLHADHRSLTEPTARAVKAAGGWLLCYTVDDPPRAHELLGWGVDALCTDRIDLIGPDFT